MPGIFRTPAHEVREFLFSGDSDRPPVPNSALEVQVKRLARATLIAIPLLLVHPAIVSAQAPLPSNAQRAFQWLQCTQQQSNGQIGSGGNPIARSSEVALGLAAAGQPASAMRSGTLSLADYLKTAVSGDVGTNGELLLARVSQSDTGPRASVAALLQAAKSTSGSSAGEYGSDIYSDALAVLGLRANGESIGQDAIDFLKSHQSSDGGWSFDNANQFGTDSNTTALVLQALISAGVPSNDASISKGFDYLAKAFSGGGFGDNPNAAPDPNSDELAIQAILAAGRQNDSAWSSMLSQALKYLEGQQIASGSDQGAISSSFSKLFATTFAPQAFLLRSLVVTGISDTEVMLLACPAASSASPTPKARPAAKTVRLAQTGQASRGGVGTGWLIGVHLATLGMFTLLRARRRRHTF